jgi:hypothetical protein
MEKLYSIIAYILGMPKDTARELARTPANPIYGRRIDVVTPITSDVVPETVRSSAGMGMRLEGNYTTTYRSRNSGHRG